MAKNPFKKMILKAPATRAETTTTTWKKRNPKTGRRYTETATTEYEYVREPRAQQVARTGVNIGVGAIGEGVARTGQALNQTINVISGQINPKEILKHAIYFIIICCIAILVIGFFRGIFVSIDQFSCTFRSTWPMGGGDTSKCDPYNYYTEIKAIYSMWDIEWMFRSLLYLGCATAVAMLLYIWGSWLFDKLLRAQKYIRMMDDWIFGFEWEDEAERQIEEKSR